MTSVLSSPASPSQLSTIRIQAHDSTSFTLPALAFDRLTVAGVQAYKYAADGRSRRSARLWLARRTLASGRVVWVLGWCTKQAAAEGSTSNRSSAVPSRASMDLHEAQLSRGLTSWPMSGMWERQQGNVHPHAFTLRSASRLVEIMCLSSADAELWLGVLVKLVSVQHSVWQAASAVSTSPDQPLDAAVMAAGEPSDPPVPLPQEEAAGNTLVDATHHSSSSCVTASSCRAVSEVVSSAMDTDPPVVSSTITYNSHDAPLPQSSTAHPSTSLLTSTAPLPLSLPPSDEFGNARAEFDFQSDAAQYPHDLQLLRGELLQLVHCDPGDDWWSGLNTSARLGLFPRSYVAVRCHACSGAFSLLRLTSDQRCRHYCCVECAGMAVRSTLELGRFPAYCFWCATEASERVGYMDQDAMQALVRSRAVDASAAQRFVRLQLATAIGHSQLTSCPRPGCGFRASVERPSTTRLTCPQCQHQYCHQCQVPWHSGLSCSDAVAAAVPRTAPAFDSATALVLNSTSKPCPRCSTQTTHYYNHGCHHIMPGGGCPGRMADGTRCGQHWCYACGRQYVEREPQCGCRGFCDNTCGCPPCPIRAASGECNCNSA